MKIVHTKRDNCRLCEENILEQVVPLEPTPVAEKYLSKDQLKDEELVCPLDLYMCESCGHVQLLDIIDPKFLYNDYTYSSGNSPGLVKHFSEYANNVIKKYNPEKNSLVVDVGSNDGTLLNFFKQNSLKVLGVDPAKEIAEKATSQGIETLPEFMNLKVAREIKAKYGLAKIVTANNAFAHSDNLIEILESIKLIMKPDGIFVFEVSYLLDVIQKVLLGTIFHEHHSYHSLIPLIKFLKKFNLEIINVERVSIQGGSLIGTVQIIGGSQKISSSVKELVDLEVKEKLNSTETLKNFAKKIKTLKKELNEIFTKIKKEGKSIVGYGAARSGTTLITQMNLGKLIDYIVDDSPQKQGKFTPGDHILVKPTSTIYEKKPDYIFILAWIHAKNIIKNNKKFLDQGGFFIICSPEIKIIGKED
jgi:SAM-dependent methyltransferase